MRISVQDFHQRFGHLTRDSMRATAALHGYKLVGDVWGFSCSTCKLANIQARPRGMEAETHPTRVNEVVAADIKYLSKPTIHKETGTSIIVDLYSYFISAHVLKRKSEALKHLRDFLATKVARHHVPPDWVGSLWLYNVLSSPSIFKSDGGGEYMSKEFREILAELGVAEHTTIADSPWQSQVEHFHKLLFNTVRASLVYACLPAIFWGYAYQFAVLTHNLSVPSKFAKLPSEDPRHNKSPWLLEYGTHPQVDNLYPFGCVLIFRVRDRDVNSLLPRGRFGQLIMMEPLFRAYLVAYRVRGGYKMIRVRNVLFAHELIPRELDWTVTGQQELSLKTDADEEVEVVVPRRQIDTDTHDEYLRTDLQVLDKEPQIRSIIPLPNDIVLDQVDVAPPAVVIDEPGPPHMLDSDDDDDCSDLDEGEEVHRAETRDESVAPQAASSNNPVPASRKLRPNEEEKMDLRALRNSLRALRQRAQGATFEDEEKEYIVPVADRAVWRQAVRSSLKETTKSNRAITFALLADKIDAICAQQSTASSSTKTERREFVEREYNTERFLEFALSQLLPPHPNHTMTTKEILDSEEGFAKLLEEYEWFLKHGVIKTTTIDRVPRDEKILRAHVVTAVKSQEVIDANGNKVEEKFFRARIVAGGDAQAPSSANSTEIAQLSTFRFLCMYGAQHGYVLEHDDVSKAYLHAKLKKEVYVWPPKRLGLPRGTVWKMLKAIYGLRESGKLWSDLMHDLLQRTGWTQSSYDSCLYYKAGCLLVLWVDDVFLAFPEHLRAMIDNDRAAWRKEVAIRTVGPLRKALGMDFEVKDGQVKLHMESYFDKLQVKYGEDPTTYGSRYTTPLPERHSARDSDEEPLDADTHKKYRSLVGELVYAAYAARVEIKLAVHVLARHLQAPTATHFSWAQHVLRYCLRTVKSVESADGTVLRLWASVRKACFGADSRPKCCVE